jgi:hypothetical protein
MTILAAMVEDAPAQAELPAYCGQCGHLIGRYVPPVFRVLFWCRRCRRSTLVTADVT